MTSGARTARAWGEWQGQIADGKFPLLKYLGGTARSAVFLTERSQGEPRQAAIKLVPADGIAADALLARWSAAARLSHPDILTIFEIGKSSLSHVAFAYVVMEYADENLEQVDRPLSESEAADMLDGVLRALSYLHSQGLVHGRLKPANILAVSDHLKVSSDNVRASGEWNRGLDARGPYAPPEIVKQGPSPAGDMWSLGVTLVEALTKRPPPAEGAVPAELVQSLPIPFRTIVSNCLRVDSNQRWTVAGIRQALESEPQESPPTPSQPRGEGLNKRFLLIAAAVVFVLGGLGIASRMTSDRAAAALPPAAAPAPVSRIENVPTKASSPIAPKLASQRVLTQVLPEVPAKARNTIRGKVVIRIRVRLDETGSVADARNESPQSSRFFGNLALQAARQWKFEPGEAAGGAHPAEWNLQFQFVRDAKRPVSAKAAPAR